MKLKFVFYVFLALGIIAMGLLFPIYMYSPGDLHPSHRTIEECATCHQPFTKPDGESCAAEGCHLASFKLYEKGVFASHVKKSGCIKCHTEHEKAGITLAPKHTGVTIAENCFECHRLGPKHIPTKDQNCRACHQLEGWLPAKFDHTLVGKNDDCFTCHKMMANHVKTSKDKCNLCHNTENWKTKHFSHTVLKPEEACTSCHVLPIEHPKTAKDCKTCHDTVKWKNVKLEHTFPVQHGKTYFMNECFTCHVESLDTFSCYLGCHGHKEKNAAQEHKGIVISDRGTCIACHPTGKKREVEYVDGQWVSLKRSDRQTSSAQPKGEGDSKQ